MGKMKEIFEEACCRARRRVQLYLALLCHYEGTKDVNLVLGPIGLLPSYCNE
jgi:hypothetical protein